MQWYTRRYILDIMYSGITDKSLDITFIYLYYKINIVYNRREVCAMWVFYGHLSYEEYGQRSYIIFLSTVHVFSFAVELSISE